MGLLGAVGSGALALPSLAIAGAPAHASALQIAVAAAIALFAFMAGLRLPRSPLLLAAGVAVVGAATWLLSQASYPVAGWIIAPMLALGVALARPAAVSGWRSGPIAVALVGAALLAGLRFGVGRDAAMIAGSLFVLVVAAPALFALRLGRLQIGDAAVVFFAALLSLSTAGYIGATTPSAGWFGSLTSHGPRSGNEVAITFDDGPNPPFTLEIASMLDAHGVKGTFFTVGKALDARPDVAKALLDDGQLLGNHSYRHDAVRWLDPRYPELQDTQDAFKKNLGVCPALYRPPHGSHTPFMAHVVSDHDMRMVTWDVSAGDWATDDAQLVAKRVLDHVRPGSIILLHDGSDGNIGADRGVILEALPIILDGLRARGLAPVTLDKLLGVPGYLPSC